MLSRRIRSSAQWGKDSSLEDWSDVAAERSRVSELGRLLQCLPQSSVDSSFAYGSGAVHQKGQSSTSSNMADFMVIVKDAEEFHRQNLKLNAFHYSALRSHRFIGAKRLADFQRHLAARVYFNTLVKIPWEGSSRLLKYGVVEVGDAARDLLDWDHLYLAGRLHKPVHWLKSPGKEVAAAERTNRTSALHTALLLLPEKFTRFQLFRTIAELSYSGDFRTAVGEDRRKVDNIVEAQIQLFKGLYMPLLKEVPTVSITLSEEIWQDQSPRATFAHLELLPRSVLWRMQDAKRERAHKDIEELMFQLSHSVDIEKEVGAAVRGIVWSSSVRQSLKNVLSAGLLKTFSYSGRKIAKMLRSMR